MTVRPHPAILVAIAQLLLLAFMAGEREWTFHHGRVVHLRTAPVDPRDVMRGDYVSLEYDISRVPRSLCRDALALPTEAATPTRRDLPVYAWLKSGDDDIGELVALSDRPPPDGPFLRGRILSADANSVHVRYGLEAYFREQGKALELEESQRRQGEQTPLEMIVAIGTGGRGLLKGHRFGPVSIDLQLEDVDGKRVLQTVRGPFVAARVQLRNTMPGPLALVDLPENRSWSLVADERFGTNPWRWVGRAGPQTAGTADNLRILQAGEAHSWRIDLLDPAWFVSRHGRPPVRIPSLTNEWSARFRLEYRIPDGALPTNEPLSTPVWRGPIRSRAFGAAGPMD